VRLAVLSLLAGCSVALGACGDTIQSKPIPHNILEGLITSPFPVYWAGGSFGRLPMTDATHDPSGSYSVQYGNCLQGGQGVCVSPLRIVTTPDNSFVPGGPAQPETTLVRGVPVVVANAGRTIVIPTGEVVVVIYASSPAVAAAAAQTVVPINAPGSPRAPLAARQPDSGFAEQPLPSQVPPRVGPLG
jgi:hypothetical protein